MPQLVIFAAFIRNQLFMAALLHDPSFIEYGDRVAEPAGGDRILLYSRNLQRPSVVLFYPKSVSVFLQGLPVIFPAEALH